MRETGRTRRRTQKADRAMVARRPRLCPPPTSGDLVRALRAPLAPPIALQRSDVELEALLVIVRALAAFAPERARFRSPAPPVRACRNRVLRFALGVAS